jgi:DNA-binding response OmpR family regulator
VLSRSFGNVVLVVEDEAVIALDLEVSLSEAGFTILLAASCEVPHAATSRSLAVAGTGDRCRLHVHS